MSLSDLLDEVTGKRKQFVVYSAGSGTDVGAQFAARNVTVTRQSLPPAGPDPFVVVRDDDEVLGAVSVDELREFLSPPVDAPWERTESEHTFFELLEEIAFASLNRRQLLATSREIEDRVWRVGAGTLHVSFQSLSVLETQVPVYERLADEREVALHLHAVPDGTDVPPLLASYPSVTLHTAPDETIERHWALAFDGGPSPSQACGLVAEEFEPDRYRGHWTYDRDRVRRIVDALETTSGADAPDSTAFSDPTVPSDSSDS